MAVSPSLGRAWRYFLPLAIFIGLVWFLWKGLALDPRKIPSALINQPTPAFSLPQLHAPDKKLTAADMKGKVWLLNVWGSWCVSCRYEHPHLNALAKQGVVPIIGLNWKDQPEAAKAWLTRFGDPYQLSVMDLDGRVAIDFGVYGAPETFVIDKAGMIRYKHTGPVDENIVRDTLVPLIQELNRA
jgi:cytochrome c biogenesis protein CcmG, thiol:disulfide interchange protein DsbE